MTTPEAAAHSASSATTVEPQTATSDSGTTPNKALGHPEHPPETGPATRSGTPAAVHAPDGSAAHPESDPDQHQAQTSGAAERDLATVQGAPEQANPSAAGPADGANPPEASADEAHAQDRPAIDSGLDQVKGRDLEGEPDSSEVPLTGRTTALEASDFDSILNDYDQSASLASSLAAELNGQRPASPRPDSFARALPGSSVFAVPDDDPAENSKIMSRIVIEGGGTPRAKLLRYSPDNEVARTRARRVSSAPDSASRSEGTVSQYQSRVRTLHLAASRKRSYDEQNPVSVSPMDMVDDLIESTQGPNPTRRMSTFMQYRAALLWYLAGNRNTNVAFEDAYQKLARTLKPARSDSRPERLSKKSIPMDHLKKLINELGSMGSWENAKIHAPSTAQLWILAILGTGIRVNEWLYTNWTDETKQRLQVYNSKRKLTHPAFRLMKEHAESQSHDGEDDDAPEVLSVHDLPASAIQPGKALDDSTEWRFIDVDVEDAAFVDRFMTALRAGIQRYMEDGDMDEETAFANIYTKCRKTIRVAVCRAFGKTHTYSLYTMRSQWAANTKRKMSLSLTSIAMGHIGGTRTTQRHYASRTSAHRKGVIFDGLTAKTVDVVKDQSFDTDDSMGETDAKTGA